jgi:hypothetical protein
MFDINNDQIRYSFLAASYRELFGLCPHPDEIYQLTQENKSYG